MILAGERGPSPSPALQRASGAPRTAADLERRLCLGPTRPPLVVATSRRRSGPRSLCVWLSLRKRQCALPCTGVMRHGGRLTSAVACHRARDPSVGRRKQRCRGVGGAARAQAGEPPAQERGSAAPFWGRRAPAAEGLGGGAAQAGAAARGQLAGGELEQPGQGPARQPRALAGRLGHRRRGPRLLGPALIRVRCASRGYMIRGCTRTARASSSLSLYLSVTWCAILRVVHAGPTCLLVHVVVVVETTGSVTCSLVCRPLTGGEQVELMAAASGGSWRRTRKTKCPVRMRLGP